MTESVNPSWSCAALHSLVRAIPTRTNPEVVTITDGIYLYFEKGENAHGVSRIVRVGTHRRDGGLVRRLQQHYRGSTRQSVFRRHLGSAIGTEDEDVITQSLQSSFYFSVISVPSRSSRARLEQRIIATIARCSGCQPSEGWLGTSAASQAIRDSGLWNVQHLTGEVMDSVDWVDLGSAIGGTIAAYGTDGESRARLPRRFPKPPDGGWETGAREPRKPGPHGGHLGVALDRLIDDLVEGEAVLTVSHRRPNWIAAVEGGALLVHTSKTQASGERPQPVPVEWLVGAVSTLEETGRLGRSDLGRGQYRSAFIFGLLARLPGVTATTNPLELRFEGEPDADKP